MRFRNNACFVSSDYVASVGKRGPKSWSERATKPRRMGMKGRMVYRTLKAKGSSALQTYRSGFRRMWDFARDHLTKWKIPEPGSWDKKNLFRGTMWSSSTEYRKRPLSGTRCARVLELCWERGITVDNLKVVKKCMSCIYLLATGIPSSNFPQVTAMFKTLDLKRCGAKKRSTLPTKILAPVQLKNAFTREWNPDGNLSLVEFCQGVLAAWDWAVLGNRPNEDLHKIKISRLHHWDLPNKCWSTSYVGGRSKLHGNKRGTRPWRAWRICLCPDNEHVSPPADMAIANDGDPVEALPEAICTTCPLFAGELLKSLQPEGELGIYKRWNLEGFGVNNHANIVDLARNWLVEQNVMSWAAPFCTNSGRKTLGAWCQLVDARYAESVHIHGDLEDTWINHYQPLLEATGSKTRVQAVDFVVATSALTKLQRYFERHAPLAPLPQGLSKDSRVLMMLARHVGMYSEARDVYMS